MRRHDIPGCLSMALQHAKEALGTIVGQEIQASSLENQESRPPIGAISPPVRLSQSSFFCMSHTHTHASTTRNAGLTGHTHRPSVLRD